ncbi:hypothetical protein EV138_0090 [Kribbella voronezhensis]|uniref:Uncharacterized protein n=1 Tax=Kribbella voronezhensis TaxID=2512212 RepID=A0A4R7T453_9ACTN|nr:hypothetical protein [Kribbella voronezhensis]TDU86580.1 hypothetical protein EV138_0090 [Kribbella voronezhensis]
MNDREFDQLIARANPIGDEAVRHLPTADAESELLEDILTTTALAPALRPNRRRVPLIAAAAAAVAIAVAVTGALFPHGNPAAPSSAFAAEAIAVAEANQRLLIDDPNWKITTVDDFSPESGMTRFTNGKLEVEIDWRPAAEYQGYYQDRAVVPHQPITVLGRQGTLFTDGKTDFDTMLPVKGSNFVEIRADLGSDRAYREVLAKLHQVDVNTWLSALPASVVQPAQTRAAVDEMLSDMALPAGFDKAPLYKNNAMDRYLLGARVSSAVGCAWVHQWIDAHKTGDQARMKEAVVAMQGSRSWKVFQEMSAQGAFPEVFQQLGDMIARNQDPTKDMQGLGC